MDQAWAEAAKHAPAAAVQALALICVVGYFIRAIKRMSADGKAITDRFLATIDSLSAKHDSADRARNEALRDLGETCHDHQQRMHHQYANTATKMTMALDRNSEQLGRNTQVLVQVEGTLEDLERRLPKPA